MEILLLPARDHLLEVDDQLLILTGTAMRQRHRCQSHHGHRIIIRGDAVLPFHSAAVAAVDQHLLPVRPECHADGGHDRAARARPVSRSPQIDVPGCQAEGTVVPVLTTGNGLPHEHAALAAAERLILVPPHVRSERLGRPTFTRSAAMRPGINR
jgi:hypothetical protein